MTDHSTDVVIIGAGPVGLFAVFECGMLNLKCHVVDALPEIGGQCTALYPEKPIYDIPGCPSVLAGDLISSLEKQAEPFKPTYHLEQAVETVEETDNNRFIVTTSKGVKIDTSAIIIAAGAGAFGPNRPPIENLSNYENVCVFYACRNKEQFRGKNIVIAGGGDSALDWAIALSDIAASTTVVHRRDKFRGSPDSVSKVKSLAENGKIKLETPYQLKDVHGEGNTLTHVKIADFDGNSKTLETDALLCFFGLASSLGSLENWGLDINHKHIKVEPSTCLTSRDGIFAVGDIADYNKKLKLILTGFAECAQAAHAIYARLRPDTPLHFEYSTTKGLPS